MLVIRKEYKVFVGVGAAILGVAALYGAMSLLTSKGSSTETASTSSGEIVTVAIPEKSEAISTEGRDGLPPPEKVDAQPIIEAKKEASDLFAESARKDGKSNDDIWTTAWNTGKVSTIETRGDAPIKVETPTKKSDLIIDPTFPVKSEDKKIAESKKNDTIVSTGTYVVQPGDNYSRIAAKLYGNKHLYSVIEKANPNVEPTKLRPGMTIKVPPASETVSLDKGAVSAEPEVVGTLDAKSQYRVISGDTLHRIAQKLYGKTAMWQSIYDTNKQKIGPDAGKLKVGMILMLPQTPSITN